MQPVTTGRNEVDNVDTISDYYTDIQIITNGTVSPKVDKFLRLLDAKITKVDSEIKHMKRLRYVLLAHIAKTFSILAISFSTELLLTQICH